MLVYSELFFVNKIPLPSPNIGVYTVHVHERSCHLNERGYGVPHAACRIKSNKIDCHFKYRLALEIPGTLLLLSHHDYHVVIIMDNVTFGNSEKNKSRR